MHLSIKMYLSIHFKNDVLCYFKNIFKTVLKMLSRYKSVVTDDGVVVHGRVSYYYTYYILTYIHTYIHIHTSYKCSTYIYTICTLVHT